MLQVSIKDTIIFSLILKRDRGRAIFFRVRKEVIVMDGRPPKWTTPEELQKDIDKYFEECKKTGEPLTITGLAIALDTYRQTLMNYEEKDEFFDTIKKAKLKIENFAEKQLYNKDVPTTGVIFNLKNNYGWVDRQELDANVNGEIVVDIEDD